MQNHAHIVSDDGYYEDPVALTRMHMRLFQHWQLTGEEQCLLLSLSPKTRSTLARYRKGESTLSSDRDTHDRVKYLLSIHKDLRTLFPYNKSLAYVWPKTPNRHFQGKTPIKVMIDEGFLGLVHVHDPSLHADYVYELIPGERQSVRVLDEARREFLSEICFI